MPPGAGACWLGGGGSGAGPPGAAGGSDVAAGRVTLPALCSYQCETGLGRRLSVPPPAGSGGCAGAPGAQGPGGGGGGAGRDGTWGGVPVRPAHVPGLLRPVGLHGGKSSPSVSPCAPQGRGLPVRGAASQYRWVCILCIRIYIYMDIGARVYGDIRSYVKRRFCRGPALRADLGPVQRSGGRAAGSRAVSPGGRELRHGGTQPGSAPGCRCRTARTRVCARSCPRVRTCYLKRTPNADPGRGGR